MAKFTWKAAEPQVVEFTVVLPGEDDPVVMELRTPTSEQVREAEREAGARPTPPNKGFIKDENGRPLPDYDYDSPAYQDRLATWNRRKLHLLILKVWAGEPIPGETDEERLNWLDGENITAFARTAIYRAVNDMIFITEDAVKMRPFRRDGADDA